MFFESIFSNHRFRMCADFHDQHVYGRKFSNDHDPNHSKAHTGIVFSKNKIETIIDTLTWHISTRLLMPETGVHDAYYDSVRRTCISVFRREQFR